MTRTTPVLCPALAPALTLALVACGPGPDPFGSEVVAEPTLFAPATFGGNEDAFAVTFSPDGREAYFTRAERARRGRGRPRIYVSRFEDGAWTTAEPAPFSTGWESTPHVTADGQRIVFSSRQAIRSWNRWRSNDNLWFVERNGDGWTEPRPLPGEVNRPEPEDEDAPDRDEIGPFVVPGAILYSTEYELGWGSDIFVADEVDGEYVDGRPLRFNTQGDEAAPALSPDGRYLFFHGHRDAYVVSDDIWVSERTEYGWSDPRRLPEPINSDDDEGFVSFSPDGRYFFFSSDRGGRGASMSIYYVSTEALGLER